MEKAAKRPIRKL